MDMYYAEIIFPARAFTREVKKILENNKYDYIAEEIGMVRVVNNLAPWGEFEELEAHFVKHEIPFDRYSGAFVSTMPLYRRYRPGMGDYTLNVVEITDGEFQPYLLVTQLRDLLSLPAEELKQKLAELIESADPKLPPVE
ncbi:MAG: hypothetical protein HPY90_11725 [Syntrophothermus sp.]|uniref:hypothetical protein n=1 Tax=Syntrophothermus sp. TaxID=2736299 RepID=UPI002580C74D|nr:hypothetical protein [Syntrophothermus sp.]NSW83916.1 hypothetical protein [Syntrophothermus sp.]